jgi:small multidrug resistance pump
MLIAASWLYLFVAIFFGVLGTICMKLSCGLQKWKPSLALFCFYALSFIALTLALRGIDISIVYAIWSGVGTIFIAVIGYLVFQESMSFRKILSLFLIVAGVLGVHLANALH